MKWWHWVLLAIASFWLWRKVAAAAASGNGLPVPASRPVSGYVMSPEQQATANEADVNWPGGAGNPRLIVPADQSMYPGFYVNEYGGYYNPETGESYSPGTSPQVHYQFGAYSTGEAERPDIGNPYQDDSNPGTGSQNLQYERPEVANYNFG
jgi:hypothetical protein